MKRLLCLCVSLALMSGCSVTKIKKGQSYVGTSMDVLQDEQKISATLVDGKLVVRVMAGKSKCDGEFEYKESTKSYLGLTVASNNYIGMFKKTKSKACIKAIGNKGNTKS